MDESLTKLYLQGMVSLYGAIAEDEALDIIRSLEQKPVTTLELTVLDLADTYVVRYGDVLAHEVVESEEELEDLLDWQDEKPFYIPDRETLLKYGDGFFFERTPAYEALKAFFISGMGLDEKTAEEICSDMQGFSTISDFEPSDVIFELSRRKIRLENRDKADQLMELVREMDRTNRTWINRGYTFDERPDPDFELSDEEWAFNPDIMLLDTIAALVNLYGAVPKAMAAEVYSSFGDRTVTVADLDELDLENEFFKPVDNLLVDEVLADDEDQLEDLLSAQADKPFYLPEPEELILYADDLYFEETPQYERLRAFLKKRYLRGEGEADAVAAEIALICRESDFSLETVLEWLEENGIHVESERQMRELEPLVFDVANHSRLWINRGHTPAEIQAMGTKAADGPKGAGRNDPCPCGSGKKYKNCCGQ